MSAHIAALESTIERLKAGEKVPDAEFERLRRLRRSPEDLERDRAIARGLVVAKGDAGSIGWKEALFGSREHSKARAVYEQRDLESGEFVP